MALKTVQILQDIANCIRRLIGRRLALRIRNSQLLFNECFLSSTNAVEFPLGDDDGMHNVDERATDGVLAARRLRPNLRWS